jgi:hypothetical protein
MTRVIEVVISPSGQTRIETHGFAGNACRDASRFLEEGLGLRTSDTSTAEAQHSTEQTTQRRIH